MPGAAGRDLAVGGIGDLSAGVARCRADDPVDLVEVGLHAPETAAREDRAGPVVRGRLRPGCSGRADEKERKENSPHDGPPPAMASRPLIAQVAARGSSTPVTFARRRRVRFAMRPNAPGKGTRLAA